jgi:hypothetical protein
MIPPWLASLSIFSVVGGFLSVTIVRGLWGSGHEMIENFRNHHLNLSDPNDSSDL